MVQYGFSPLQFGAMMITGLAIGLVTPPVGMCLNACNKINRMPIIEIFKGAAPLRDLQRDRSDLYQPMGPAYYRPAAAAAGDLARRPSAALRRKTDLKRTGPRKENLPGSCCCRGKNYSLWSASQRRAI